MRKILVSALFCAGLALPAATRVQAHPDQDEGVILAIMGTSDRVDLIGGQTIIFRPDRGRMTMIRFVEGPMEPGDGEVKLVFEKRDGQTSLTATNNSDQSYRYRAEILKGLGAKKGVPTTVCPILARGGATESWSQDIAALRIMDLQAADAGDTACQ